MHLNSDFGQMYFVKLWFPFVALLLHRDTSFHNTTAIRFGLYASVLSYTYVLKVDKSENEFNMKARLKAETK